MRGECKQNVKLHKYTKKSRKEDEKDCLQIFTKYLLK